MSWLRAWVKRYWFSKWHPRGALIVRKNRSILFVNLGIIPLLFTPPRSWWRPLQNLTGLAKITSAVEAALQSEPQWQNQWCKQEVLQLWGRGRARPKTRLTPNSMKSALPSARQPVATESGDKNSRPMTYESAEALKLQIAGERKWVVLCKESPALNQPDNSCEDRVNIGLVVSLQDCLHRRCALWSAPGIF